MIDIAFKAGVFVAEVFLRDGDTELIDFTCPEGRFFSVMSGPAKREASDPVKQTAKSRRFVVLF